jgi:A/G-specific adenine glycosylase
VASIAFGVPIPVVDGKVERVIVRLGADTGEHGAARRRRVEEAARRLVTGLLGEDAQAIEPPGGLRPGDVNQALMELGATVCAPRAPECPRCPWARTCIGRRSGLAPELPRRSPRAAVRDVTLHMALVRRGDRLLLVRRPEGALLSGLWELPTSPENGARDQLVALLAALGPELASALPDEPSATVRHSITDRRIRALVYDVRLGAGLRGDARRVAEAEAAAWVTSDELSGYGASSLVAKALRSLGGSS